MIQSITLTKEQQELLNKQGSLEIFFHNVFTQKDYDEGQTGVSELPNGDLLSYNKGGIKIGQIIQRHFQEEPKLTDKQKVRNVFIQWLNDNADKYGEFAEKFNSLSSGQKNMVVDGIIDALTNTVKELTLLTIAKTINRGEA